MLKVSGIPIVVQFTGIISGLLKLLVVLQVRERLMSTGNGTAAVPGTGVPCSLKITLRMICMIPVNVMKIIGVRS